MNLLTDGKLYFVIILLLTIVGTGCSEQKINEENIAQIEDLGIRRGVFERKFKMTDVYNKNNEFTPEMLKNSLDKILLTEHLLIYDAYRLGFDKDPKIQNTMLEFKLNLISTSHPIHTENLTLPKEKMIEFYDKKKFTYDFEVIQHNSFYWADSLSKYLSKGNELDISEAKKKTVIYPRKIDFVNSTYCNDVPPEIYNVILELKEGEVSKPIYSGPVWTVVKLNKKNNNEYLKTYDEMLNSIVDQLQPILKNDLINNLTEELRIKYKVEINKENLKNIYNAFKVKDGNGSFDRSLLKNSDITDILIKTSRENFNIDFIIFMLNRSNIFRNIEKLMLNELDIVVENIADMIVFYFDGLEKGVDKNELIQDKIENKENRLLYSEYLKDEITNKVTVSEDEAREFYDKNRDKWPGEFKNVNKSIISELRQKKMYQRRDDLVEQFKKDFNVRYNETLLQELAEKFTGEKKNN